MPVTQLPFKAFIPDGSRYGQDLDTFENALPINMGARPLQRKSQVVATADGPMTGAHVHIYQSLFQEQVARPSADAGGALWWPNSGTTFFDKLNEETPDDAGFIISSKGSVAHSSYTVNLSALTTPAGGTQKMRWRYRMRDFSPLFGTPHVVSSITRSGGTATATTFAAHGLSTGATVAIAGADQVEYNVVSNITVTGASTFTYPVSGTPTTPATSAAGMTWQATAERNVVSITRAVSTATVTTAVAHGLSTNTFVVIANAAQPEYNGIFQVTVVDATHFTYAVTGTPATPATGSITWYPPAEATLSLMEGVTQRATSTVRAATSMTGFLTAETTPAPAVGNWANLLFNFDWNQGAAPTGSQQLLQPSADGASVGAWTPSVGTSLFSVVDDLDADDSDYFQSPALAPGQVVSQIIKLPDSDSPVTLFAQHTVSYRYFAANAGMTLVVSLLQGGDDTGSGSTVLISWTHSSIIAGSWNTAAQTINNIGNLGSVATLGYKNLKLKFEASYPAAVTSTVQQSARASASVSSAGFSFTGAASLAAAINESVASDSEYIYSIAFAGSPDSLFSLNSVTAPGLSTDHVLRVRHYKLSGAPTLTATLKQGATTVTAFTVSPGFAATTTAHTLSAAEVALISDYSQLRLEFTTGSQDAVVTWAELAVPTPRQVKVSWAQVVLASKARLEISWAEYRAPTSDSIYRGDAPTRFCGSPHDLYTFDDVKGFQNLSKSAAAYGTAPNIPGGWSFCTWGNHVVATNFVDPVQYRANNTGNFADLITSVEKPRARFCAAARGMLLLGGINNVLSGHEADEVWWSALENIVDFHPAAAVTQCDFQRLLATPGQVMGLVSGNDPFVFKRHSLYRLFWSDGPLVWDPQVVSDSVGTPFPRSMVAAQGTLYWWGGDTFYRMSMAPGAVPQPFGGPIISRYLTDNAFSAGAISPAAPAGLKEEDQMMVGAFDCYAGLLFWTYRGVNDQPWQHSHGIVYDPFEDRWATIAFGTAVGINKIVATQSSSSGLVTVPNSMGELHTLRGVLGLDWDGTSSTWFRFNGDSTYSVTLRTKVFPIQMEQDGRPRRVRLKGVLPVFTADELTGETWPDITITVTSAEDPRFVIGAVTTPLTASTAADLRQFLPFDQEGYWWQITLTVPTMSRKIMRTIDALYLDWELRGS